MPAVSDSDRPSGKYAERMIKGAWPETSKGTLAAEERRWRGLRDAARNTHEDMLDNNRQLRTALQSNGFDALHQDRDLVARNFDMLAETRHGAMTIIEQAAHGRDLLRRSITSTVHLVEQEIAVVEANPLLDGDTKQQVIDGLVEATNAELIARSAAAGALVTAAVTKHLAYLASLPWHMSTADSASSFTPSSNGNGVQAMSAGWKQSPAPTETGSGASGTGQGPGTGGQRPGQQQTPGQAKDDAPGAGQQKPGSTQKPGTAGQPGTKSPDGTTPRPGATQTPGTVSTAPGTNGAATPGQTQTPTLSLPPIGGGGGGAGGGPGGGLSGLGGGGAGGLRMPGSFAGPPQVCCQVSCRGLRRCRRRVRCRR